MSTFVCPICDAVSHNPGDAIERYCGRCHVFVADVEEAPISVRKAMVRHFRRLAGRSPGPARREAHLALARVWERAIERGI
jgi:hypothetical protein